MAGGGVKQINNYIRGGADGITYTPVMRADGKLYFVPNRSGLPEIGGYEIKGADGVDGRDGAPGPTGPTGAKIVDQYLSGVDENGGNIYTQVFDDGTIETFTAPKGAKGDVGNIDISAYSTTEEMEAYVNETIATAITNTLNSEV